MNNINPITQIITRDALRSTDSGHYTCTVTDNAGNNGSDSTQVEVIGMVTMPFLCYLSSKKVEQMLHDYFKALPVQNVSILSLTSRDLGILIT